MVRKDNKMIKNLTIHATDTRSEIFKANNRLPPIVKMLEKSNDISRLKTIFLNFKDEYLGLIQKNQGASGFSFKNIGNCLDMLGLENEKFIFTLEKTLPATELKNNFKPALTKAQLIKAGNIKTRVF